ncbi:MAG: MucB/RseB C-terminal domain-containing protein [Gammaproteobacteria bacterium]|nr:MucB/RseB C-terminal domain-containing protein [Gammaproteobacteria bacterium]
MTAAVSRTWRRLALLLALFASTSASAGAGADMTAEQWLAAMSQAMRSLNYEGELIYQHDKGLKVLHLIHTVRQGRERERLISLNGVPREVIRDEDSVRCILPDSQAISVDRRAGSFGFTSLQPLVAEKLSGVYRFSVGEEARVAGRQVRSIDIQPQDAYRYGHRLYLDMQHHLPLKQELLDTQGNPVGLIMYSRIKIDPALPFEASGAGPNSKSYSLIEYGPRQEMNGQGSDIWHLTQLPPGFAVNHRDFRDDEQGVRREHLVLSDGLASVSLYIEPAQASAGLSGASHRGAVSVFGRQHQGYQILVVGEVPELTARFIAEAVEIKP